MCASESDGLDGLVRRTHQSFHLRRMDFLWTSGRRTVPPALHRTQHAPPLSLLGLPLGPRPLRSRRPRPHLQHLARPPRALQYRPPPNPRRPPLLPPLEQIDFDEQSWWESIESL